MKLYTIGLVGNPNSGKTTLFNQLTGSHQRVGNWPGVTVERKQGNFTTELHNICLVDLPGTYSLTAVSDHTSIDEQIVCEYIIYGNADIIINVIDASNMERNLYLTLQILQLGIPCIIALNMLDIAKKKNLHLDMQALSISLGCPVVPLISRLGKGIDQLKREIDRHPLTPASFYINWPEILSPYIQKLSSLIPSNYTYQQRQWLAVQILEGDSRIIRNLPKAASILPAIQQELQKNKNDAALLIVNSRYQVIEKITTKIQKSYSKNKSSSLSEKIDRVILNRWLGIPFFLLLMYLMFFFAINVGSALQPLFDIGSTALFIHGVQWLGYTFHCPYKITFFIAQGIGGGINTILPLIPTITIMYLFISLIEESGYMARAAFIMDRLMQILGLPGKSFIPLLIGFGCNVPSVISTRTLNTPRERIITIMMVPFISCSARLTIFAVFASSFFNKNGTLVVFSLYILGIVAAIFTGMILKYTIMAGEPVPFVMELPIYHLPHGKSILLQTWQRLKGFLYRAGKIIITASMIISALNSFSFNGKLVKDVNESALATVSHKLTIVLTPMGISNNNWQAIVGLLAGTLAKEVIIGTLNTLYTAESISKVDFEPARFNFNSELWKALSETHEQLIKLFSFKEFSNPIKASSGNEKFSSGAIGIMSSKFSSNIVAYSYLIFVLLYVPCASVMGAISRETSSAWMLFSIFWGLDLAWSLSSLFYQLATFSKHCYYSLIIIIIILLLNLFMVFLLRHLANYYNLKSKHLVTYGNN
ncbi:MAG: Fe(2+) transporter permease subunit FeoB [Candidatus Dasytiphilus stammeri]